MSDEEKSVARGSLATVVATAAVTLAVGMTAAAIGGYFVPNRVLVPVTQESRGGQPAAVPPPSGPEVVFAAYAPTEHEDGDEDEDDDD